MVHLGNGVPFMHCSNQLPIMQTIFENLGYYLCHCAKLRSSNLGTSLHSVLLKYGLQFDVVISNHVINMYAKCRDLCSARKVFEEMPVRNLVSWSALISGYDQGGMPGKALELFSCMRICPNEYVYSSVISSCASLSAVFTAKQIHAMAINSGYERASFVSNSLISLYMECGLPDNALSVFRRMAEPNVVSFNSVIAGCAGNSLYVEGLELFKEMQRQGVGADRFTFTGLFEICRCMDDIAVGTALHCLTIKLGSCDTAFVGNLVLTMYSTYNLVEAVEMVFDEIQDKDIVSCNAYVAAVTQSGDHMKALSIFSDHRHSYILMPDYFTYSIVLSACGHVASLRYGSQVHAHLIRTMVEIDAGVWNALLSMYSKCGFVGKAKLLFDCMKKRNLVSWNTIIAGYSNNGNGKECLEIFEQMKEKQVVPDSLTFLNLLSACRHMGMVDEGLHYYNCMERVYGINPEIEHFSCLIDLFGRTGRFQEAENLLKNSSFEEDMVVLGSLLSSCRLHGNNDLGEKVGKRILELKPEISAPFVLMSNLYASNERWQDVAASRRMLKGSRVKKAAGYSLIEIGGNMEKFTVGDFSHSMSAESKEVLENLNWILTKFF